MRTAELHARLGCTNNMLHRLTERGILQPQRAGEPDGATTHRWGYRYEWDESEQRAAEACVRLIRSGMWGRGRDYVRRDECLRAVAAAARAPLPAILAPRWLILLADGSCVRGDALLAAAMTDHRTLVPLREISAADLAMTDAEP